MDLIVAGDGLPLVLEVNTLPGMTELSDLPAEARAEGKHPLDTIPSVFLKKGPNTVSPLSVRLRTPREL